MERRARRKRERQEEVARKVKVSFGKNNYSKYFVEHPNLYNRFLENNGAHGNNSKVNQTSIMNKSKMKDQIGKDKYGRRSYKSNETIAQKNNNESYEKIFSSKKKMILYKQRKKLFDSIRASSAVKGFSLSKKNKQVENQTKQSSEIRPNSAPIDGEIFRIWFCSTGLGNGHWPNISIEHNK